MNFDFSDEQYLYQETFANFLNEKHTLDRYMSRYDEKGIDQETWSQLAEMGLFSLLIPEDYDGVGLSFIDLALIIEELGKAIVSPPVAETLACTDLIIRYGSAEQKKELLPLIAAGKISVVPALMEETSGYQLDNIKLLLSGNKKKGYSLSGKKIMVPHAGEADYILVVARFEETSELGALLVEPSRDGISLREHNTYDPPSQFHELNMDNVSVDSGDVLGGSSSKMLIDRLEDVLSGIAALQMLGIADKVLELSVRYASEREQFGKPIGSFQAIKHKCADMAVAIDGCRSAAYFAAWALAEDAPNRSRAISTAKSFCGDTSRDVCNEGIQVHGGMGFTWELGLHHYLRRSKILEHSFGDASFHRERVITKTLSEL